MAILILFTFGIGYLAIAFEEYIHINKAATALVLGVLCWTIYAMNADAHVVSSQLSEQVTSISSILFFLIGAMTIVQLIDAHDGFSIVYKLIKVSKTSSLLAIICLISFFLSAVLDNLTTAIIMVTVINKLMKDNPFRIYFIGMIVIAANAGGVWSPIGDVTSTMLWTGGRVSSRHLISGLFLPSLCSLLAPLFIAIRMVKGAERDIETIGEVEQPQAKHFEKNFVFFTGIGILLLVPIFKTVTHFPPFMGITLGMGLLWMITGLLHKGKSRREKYSLSVNHALEKIDMPSVLFFLGILLAVGALEATGQLHFMANNIGRFLSNDKLIVSFIGLLSAVIDNVPLVAATMGMYPLSVYPVDHSFWLFLSYSAGTGGSLLIIGSAAGIAAMGIGHVSFGQYLKKISWLALVGFVAGIGVFFLQGLLS